MRAYLPQQLRIPGSGYAWPDTGLSTHGNVADVFGPRLFPAHVATEGFNYDYHRGIDINYNAIGNTTYSPICGNIIRWSYTHFGWEHDDQLSRWSSVNSFNKSRSASVITVSGLRNANNAGFTTSLPRYQNTSKLEMVTADWELQLKYNSAFSTAGAFGYGILSTENSEFLTADYDGTTHTAKGTDKNGSVSFTGGSTSASANLWSRMRFVQASGTYLWDRSSDGVTWTNYAKSTTAAFTTTAGPAYRVMLYYRAKDSPGTTETCDIDFIGWYDNNTIGRFGNWVEIASQSNKILMAHHRELTSLPGSRVLAGDAIGRTGATGFDTQSGRIATPHTHVEWIPNNNFIYSQNESKNPLDSSILPRTNVSNNVSATITSVNDPDAVSSHLLQLSATRADQDFDVNEISMTGTTTTRTINFNTRGGINTSNDTPKVSGVYIVPHSFDSTTSPWVLDVYFNNAVVGNNVLSAYIKDTKGNVLWSQ
jgi:hypothetical protein